MSYFTLADLIYIVDENIWSRLGLATLLTYPQRQARNQSAANVLIADSLLVIGSKLLLSALSHDVEAISSGSSCHHFVFQILLSLHEMIEQKGEAGKAIESKLLNLADELHAVLNQHIEVGNYFHRVVKQLDFLPNVSLRTVTVVN